jgi:hypothetical protein
MGGVSSIRNMYQMLPPLMSTINEQTGIGEPFFYTSIFGSSSLSSKLENCGAN